MRYLIRWQTIIALAGTALLATYLSSLVVIRTTVVVPERGGTYIEGIAGTPQFINPTLAQYNPVDQDLTALIFNGLTRFDSSGQAQPDLAKNWSVSDDGLSYVFRLREDVQWSDGHRFDADDVLFTIKLMQDPDFPGVPYLHDLWSTVRAEKIDEFTLRFVLPEPFPPFMDYTSIGILPEHILSDVSGQELLNHPFNLSPVGTGPFRLESITAQRAVLVSNQRYAGAPSLINHLEFRFYPNQQSVYAAYEVGEINGIGSVPPNEMQRLQQIENLDIYTARLARYTLIYLNLQDKAGLPFFQERMVRQALQLALDRQRIIDEALFGQGVPLNGPILPWSWAFDPTLPEPDYDLEQAAQLLDEAGWIDSDNDAPRHKQGRPLAFSLLVEDRPDLQAVAEIVARQWRALGIEVELQPPGAGLGEQLSTGQYEAALVELQLSGDPDPYPFWHQTQIDGGQNYAGWDHRAASEALEAARATLDQGRRTELYREFQQIFAEETPALVLYAPVYIYALDQNVKGVQLSPLADPADRFRNLSDWYVLTRRVIVSESVRNPILAVPTTQP
ncbi:MAG: peptide ABC transporter substrate-binding protein [Anaerolineae bacterium]